MTEARLVRRDNTGIVTYRIQARHENGGGWNCVGRFSYDTESEAHVIAARFREEYPKHLFRVQEHVR